MKKSEFDYLERPKQFDRDDFWRQVRRTINGVPVSEDQLEIIITQIVSSLDLQKTDDLLDIGCGNGALTVKLEPFVENILGVDYSDYLIGIAKEYFESSTLIFETLKIENLIKSEKNVNYKKALLYGVSSYLSDDLLESLISWFFSNNTKATLFIGNIREKKYSLEFYKMEKSEKEISDHTTAIGKWRTEEWFLNIANRMRLNTEFKKMPDAFYASNYYFDLVLSHD